MVFNERLPRIAWYEKYGDVRILNAGTVWKSGSGGEDLFFKDFFKPQEAIQGKQACK